MKDLKEVNLQVDLHILWSNLSLCPDRDFVVFESFEIDNYDIVIENLKEKRLLKLTTDLSHERHPRWSNKGDLIVFSSNRKTPRPDEIKW